MIARLLREANEMAPQPWHGKVHEGSDFRYGKSTMRRDHVHGFRRKFVACEKTFKLSLAYVLGDLVR